MSNRAIWNVRLRHEWLQKPHKGKRMKRRTRLRVGFPDTVESPDSESNDQNEANSEG